MEGELDLEGQFIKTLILYFALKDIDEEHTNSLWIDFLFVFIMTLLSNDSSPSAFALSTTHT